MRPIPFVATLGLAALMSLPALAQNATMPTATMAQGVISVSGHGEVSAKPDTAYMNSGVTSQGATAREALDANTADMAKLLEALKAAGIAAKDIQTSGFSVNPNYVYTEERDANGYSLPPRVNGYMVTNSVTVRIRDLELLGAVLDKAVTVGANTINGITFSVADPAKLYEEARRAAFRDAAGKAELYAEVAEEELGSLVSITESQGYGQPQPYMMRQQAEVAMASDAAVPVEAGELSFSIDVQVSWALEPEFTGTN